MRLRTRDDLMVTAVGHALTLVPGSFVVEVDRRTSTLYLHVLNVKHHAEVDGPRATSLDIEARLIRMMGTRGRGGRIDAERAGRPPAAAEHDCTRPAGHQGGAQ